MPIVPPRPTTQAVAESFKETTAPYREAGPVEQLPPISPELKQALFNGITPLAVKAERWVAGGQNVSMAATRAMEVAVKLKSGGDLSAGELAQSWFAVREALDGGLEDQNSPYFIQNEQARNLTRQELDNLQLEINGYLTQEARQPRTVTERTLRSRIPLIGGRFQKFYEITYIPPSDVPLGQYDQQRIERQSVLQRGYHSKLNEVAQSRFGKDFASVSEKDQREARLLAVEALSTAWDLKRAREILAQVTERPQKGTIDDALENGTDSEKQLAARAQRLEETREKILQKSSEVTKITKMSQFQEFLGLDDKVLSGQEIAEAITQRLGLTGADAARLKSNPDEAFKQLFEQTGVVGLIPFIGELYRNKLEGRALARSKAEEKPIEKKSTETAPGAAAKEFSATGYEQLLPEDLALSLVDGKLGTDPLTFLKEKGIPEDQAKVILESANQFVNRKADGTYELNQDKFGLWSDSSLAGLVKRGVLDINQAVKFRETLEKGLLDAYPDAAARNKALDEKIGNIKEFLEGLNPAQLEGERKRILKKWDKGTLAYLILLLGQVFMQQIMSSLAPHERRSLMNYLTLQ